MIWPIYHPSNIHVTQASFDIAIGNVNKYDSNVNNDNNNNSNTTTTTTTTTNNNNNNNNKNNNNNIFFNCCNFVHF